jgi:hypothetical protein
LKQKHQIKNCCKSSRNRKDRGIAERDCQRGGKCRCTKQSWYQLSNICVVTHYDTLQAIGAETNSNLILLPNSPQDECWIIWWPTASNMVGNQWKEIKAKTKAKTILPL